MTDSVRDTRPVRDPADVPFWLTPPAYWLPSHYPVSAWLTHAPFASWIVAALRPASIAELGTHYGFSCFVFAEAVKRLRLPSIVSALDSWEGDDHAGFYDETVYDSVDAVVKADYPDSVRLVRGWFSESRSHFPDRSIDLLHIDGRHAYEDVLTDYTEWLPTVRDGGVILFHDISEREKGFGVWKLWEEIAEPGRSFTFEHGHGLGVLGVGDVASPGLQALFDADAATADRIRDDFSRLGDVVARQAWLESLPAEFDRVNALAHERALHVNELSAALAAQAEYIDSLTSSTSWRVTAPLRAVGKLRSPRD